MSRTPKEGLDYFPLDVTFFQDLKIKKLRRLHGPVGLVVYLNLLCRVYSNGYQLRFDNLDDLAFDIAEDITSDKMSRCSEKIAQVILDIGHLGLCNISQLEKGVITSDSIEQQYKESLKKSKRVIPTPLSNNTEEKTKNTSKNSLNTEEKRIHSEEKRISSEEIAITSEDMQQNKINKSKLKESILNNPLYNPPSLNEQIPLEEKKMDTLKEIRTRFDIFWHNYPRKQGKDKCQRWFESHKPSQELVNQMLIAISEQKTSDQWLDDKGKYIPMPYTWLNQGRWKDVITIEQPTNINYASSSTSAPKNKAIEEEEISDEELEELRRLAADLK